jgi:SWI/SNF-related matrix-associated actin-dependent regulator of chromatin subfamily A member 5
MATIDVDPLTTFLPPPVKRRKLVAVAPSPPKLKLSELLAAFHARPVSSSITKMAISDLKNLRPQKTGFSYAESSPSNSPTNSEGSNFDQAPDAKSSRKAYDYDDEDEEDDVSDSADELNSDDNVIGKPSIAPNADSPLTSIQVAPTPTATRELPKRSTRSNISYATPIKKKKMKSKKSKGRSSKSSKLTSDLLNAAQPAKSTTARGKVHEDIAAHTKPKRDAFYLANKDYFLPLLPETSYIDKLQRIQDMSDESEVEVTAYESLKQQPDGVTAVMKPYQLEGLSYLVWLHNNGMSGILGDEMGLGKTLQTLSLFQYIKEHESASLQGEQRPHLIVCPLSVLSSWMSEAKKWTPELEVVRFHGPVKEREKLKEDCRRSANVDAIVTTYETFVAEQNWFKRAFVWRYCVLDEGHKIKSMYLLPFHDSC